MELPDWWTPAKRTDIKVIGPDATEPGFLRIRFQLGPKIAHENWVKYFLHPQLDHWQAFRRPSQESSGMSGMSGVGMSGVGFVAKVEDHRLADFVATIDMCVVAANKKFEREDIPRMQAEEARAEEKEEALKERIAEAQRKLDKLGE